MQPPKIIMLQDYKDPQVPIDSKAIKGDYFNSESYNYPSLPQPPLVNFNRSNINYKPQLQNNSTIEPNPPYYAIQKRVQDVI